MNFKTFFLISITSQAESQIPSKRVTRYECHFRLNTPRTTRRQLSRSIRVSKPSHEPVTDPVFMSLSIGRKRVEARGHYLRSDAAVTLNLHRTIEHGMPQCNGIGLKDKGKAFGKDGRINILITAKIILDYDSRQHPEDCKSNEVGYSTSSTCNRNGSLCVDLRTGLHRCRCNGEYGGRYCQHINPWR